MSKRQEPASGPQVCPRAWLLTHSLPNPPELHPGDPVLPLPSEDPEAQARPWSGPGLEDTPVPSSDELIRAMLLSITWSDVCPLPRRLKRKALNHS